MIDEERRTKIARLVDGHIQNGLSQPDAELIVATEIGVKPDTIRRYKDLKNGPKRLPDDPVARGIVLLRCLASKAWQNACPWGILEGRPLLEEQRDDVIAELGRLAFESDQSDEDIQVMLAVLKLRTGEDDRLLPRKLNTSGKPWGDTELVEPVPIPRDKLRLMKGLYYTLLKEVSSFRRLVKEIERSGRAGDGWDYHPRLSKYISHKQFWDIYLQLGGDYKYEKRLSLAENTAPVGPDPQPILDAMKEDRLSQRQPPLLALSSKTDNDETDNGETDAPYECGSPTWAK